MSLRDGAFRTFWAGLVFVGLGLSTAQSDYLYAVSESPSVLQVIDSSSGHAISTVPLTGTDGGVRDVLNVNGQLLLSGYGSSYGAPGGDDVLFNLNPTTGVATPIGVMTNGMGTNYFVEGLAWVNGTLYGSASAFLPGNPPTYEGYGPDSSNLLIQIDPTNGHVTEIGAFGPDFLNVQNLAYSPQYGLIGSDIGTLDPNPNLPNGKYSSFHTTPALISINTSTGVATKIADFPTGNGALISNPFNNFLSPAATYVAGLEFSPDGSTLYGSTIQTHFGGTSSGLVTIDPLTGAVTQIGTINESLTVGITFVPEPSAIALFGLGLACVGLRRYRSSRSN